MATTRSLEERFRENLRALGVQPGARVHAAVSGAWCCTTAIITLQTVEQDQVL
jgi:hypothetical protein